MIAIRDRLVSCCFVDCPALLLPVGQLARRLQRHCSCCCSAMLLLDVQRHTVGRRPGTSSCPCLWQNCTPRSRGTGSFSMAANKRWPVSTVSCSGSKLAWCGRCKASRSEVRMQLTKIVWNRNGRTSRGQLSNVCGQHSLRCNKTNSFLVFSGVALAEAQNNNHK